MKRIKHFYQVISNDSLRSTGSPCPELHFCDIYWQSYVLITMHGPLEPLEHIALHLA
jgi:hypothetical protein